MARLSFWSLNIGLAWMMFAILLPLGPCNHVTARHNDRVLIRTRLEADDDACVAVMERTHAVDGYPRYWPAKPARFLRAQGETAVRNLVAMIRGAVTSGEPVVMPLLADRDLSASGVEVDLCGHRARMAAGPASIERVEPDSPAFRFLL